MTWFSIFESAPANGATVYVRILNYYGEPFTATYNSTTQVFTSVADGITFPAYYVARWRN